MNEQERNGTRAGGYPGGYSRRSGPYFQNTDYRFRQQDFRKSESVQLMKQILRLPGNRRGSAIAEAAIVLPVTIMVTVTVLLIIVFFSNLSMEQSRMHMAIREIAGTGEGHTVTVSSQPAFSGRISTDDEYVRGESRLTLPDLFSMLNSDSSSVEARGRKWNGVKNAGNSTWLSKAGNNSLK